MGASLLKCLANAAAQIDGGQPIDVIFDDPPIDAAFGGAGMQARRPRLTCSIADAADAGEGAAVMLTFRGVQTDYTVAERDSDDHQAGHAVLYLARS